MTNCWICCVPSKRPTRSCSLKKELHHYCGPLTCLAFHGDGALMRSDEVTCDTQPQPHTLPLALGREERGKDMRQMFCRNAWTCIGNFNPEMLSRSVGLNTEFTHRAIVCHRLTR